MLAYSWIHRLRKVIIVVSQAILLAISYYSSFLLRFDFALQDAYPKVMLQTLPIALAIKLVTFYFFRLYRGWWRYVGMSDLLDIIKAAIVSSATLYGVIYFTRGLVGFPRSVFFIDLILTISLIGGLRFAVRAYTEAARNQSSGTNTLIIGAGVAGTTIVREIQNNDKLTYNVIGFIDDDPAKKRERISGIKVLGNTANLPDIIIKYDIAQILIAIPSATGKQVQHIIDMCRECKVDFKTLPALADLISGSVSVGSLRKVKVEDLLVREPVKLDFANIQRKFQGRVALITGAGGSIGSELTRQLARFEPEKLVFFERSESDLHRIDLEFAEKFPKVNRVSVIGDVLMSTACAR
jgi:FlaA1/EpsC-like NDP-sugar epimerase